MSEPTNSAASVSRPSLASTALQQHWNLVELSHLASLAAERLADTRMARPSNTPAVLAMLGEIRQAGRETFLRTGGSKQDYEDIGKKVAKRFKTASGTWRKIKMEPRAWTLQAYTSEIGTKPDTVETLDTPEAVVERIATIQAEDPQTRIGVHGGADIPFDEVDRLNEMLSARGLNLENLFPLRLHSVRL